MNLPQVEPASDAKPHAPDHISRELLVIADDPPISFLPELYELVLLFRQNKILKTLPSYEWTTYTETFFNE